MRKNYFRFKFHISAILLFCSLHAVAQHENNLTATIDDETKEISIKQKFTYVNNSDTSHKELYFNDWNHSYSSKKTPLAKRFGEQFKKSLHLAKDDERGRTDIVSVVDSEYSGLKWERTKNLDIIRVELHEALAPGESITIFFTYNLKLPQNRFTPYGYNSDGGYYLKDWYLNPAVFDGDWKLYSNKNLEDNYTGLTNTTVSLIFPKKLFLTSNFKESRVTDISFAQQISLKATNGKNCEIILTNTKEFTKHVTSYLTVKTDLESKKYDGISQALSIEKVSKFIYDHLGEHPQKEVLVSEMDYNKSPLYGLNQLPSFVRPYQEQFQFEMMFLKTALNSFLKESLYLDPRQERWVSDAISNYLMIKYVEENYPKQKLIGKLSRIWGVRGFHLAKMDFNEQYYLLQMLSTRKNIDQALTTPNDSLIKFNQKIANRYKAGLGLAYLAEYIGEEKIDSSISSFFKKRALQPKTKARDFRDILEANTDKDISWFFEEYVGTRKRIDFKIKNVIKSEDSITLTIKNKRGTNVPISLFGLQKDSVVSKYWFSDIDTSRTFTIPRTTEDRLVLNYDQKIPEFNQRDNWKTLNGFFSSNKKLQFRFFKDTEDPYYTQVFYVPIANFNLYDGITPGLRIYNKTFLERQFVYDLSPTYSFLERTLVGKTSLRYRKYHGKGGHYVSNFSIGASTSHFQENSRFTTITPAMSFGWRPDDLISNKRQGLLFRHRSVFRNIDPNVLANNEADLDLENNPDYSVFNVRYFNVDNDIINFKSSLIDFQHSSEFTKASVELEYRKLYESNRQLNLRFYAGKFIRNKTNSDFFSYALDRPTDYLFDLGYLGRSEGSGIYSQQIIIAEGGFKSRFEDQFGSDWIATTNASFNIWRWIELYGDIGMIADRGESARFVYDSGIRLNLVTDYFELYFPLYSNKGWEIAQPDYGQSIRFIVTISPKTLTGLFTRKWF
ncbi:metalloprotease [Croceitalea marina]|uniref:Metalloprotease n=1 Tax=Croceitalea marina TaxID=1775166 RepID=A0ABW5MQE3_9FLAO